MANGIRIGGLVIHYYGILIMIGALAGSYLASREARRRGQDNEMIWDLLPWLLIGGIIGARIWHLLTPTASQVALGITPYYYLTHPLDAMAIWRGGLGIPGGVLGGVLALWIYTRKYRLSFGLIADIAAPGLALAQAIGRWGNFVNQEVYGAPSNLPWAIFIDRLYRLPGYENIERYHPLFLYESIYNLFNMALLLWISRRFAGWLKNGDVFLFYLVIYPAGRFMLEFLRLDTSPLGSINANQTIMGLIAVAAAAALIWQHRGKKLSEEPPVEAAPAAGEEE